MPKTVKTIKTSNCAFIDIAQGEASDNITIKGYGFAPADMRELADYLTERANELAPLVEAPASYEPLVPALTPQDAKVVKHLNRRGSISSLEAMDGYRIRRLAASIFRLKANGYEFKKVMKQDATGQRYARYYVDATPERIAA